LMRVKHIVSELLH